MKLEFTLPELQYIVNTLEQRPYVEVVALLMNIKAQFDAAAKPPPVDSTSPPP